MSTSTVRKKGQVVIQAGVRSDPNIDAGARSELVDTADGYLLKAATRSVTALKGMLDAPATPTTVEQMKRVIRLRAAVRRRR